ncbi:MAG: RES domain-containing protein [Gemmatimonadota bacterium]|nr:RES domain-containing protein [Gemmatimonadota bacterium]MDE2866457.1 RES domain-containing protein [Gemmatimonadota bacterium]
MDVYRIHDRRFHALSGFGANARGGRWNPRGVPVVYTSPAYEGTLLEVLAHMEASHIPRGHVASRIVLPNRCDVKVLDEADFPDWSDRTVSRGIGRDWVESQRSLALEVPSHIAQPWGRNVLLNPRHADFDRVRVAEIADIGWDPRLF